MALPISLLLGVPLQAEALELSTGVSAGGFLAGTVPHVAVTPQVRLLWRKDNGLVVTVQEMLSLLVPNSDSVGVYAHTAATIGNAMESHDFSVGPSLSAYYMPACGTTLCGHVAGLAPGGHAQVNSYFFGALGLSVSASVEWIGGRSLILPGGVAAMVVAGPVLRWTTRA
jgi:hypothetical protein